MSQLGHEWWENMV